jgi:hypothetical protein
MNKYHAKKVIIDGITFDSTKEGNRYTKLKALEKLGAIRDLKLQVPFELQPPFSFGKKRIQSIKYIADFTYYKADRDGNKVFIVEDAKGDRTDLYKLKAKMFLFKYGFAITET